LSEADDADDDNDDTNPLIFPPPGTLGSMMDFLKSQGVDTKWLKSSLKVLQIAGLLNAPFVLNVEAIAARMLQFNVPCKDVEDAVTAKEDAELTVESRFGIPVSDANEIERMASCKAAFASISNIPKVSATTRKNRTGPDSNPVLVWAHSPLLCETRTRVPNLTSITLS
jgi:hypothetical protein